MSKVVQRLTARHEGAIFHSGAARASSSVHSGLCTPHVRSQDCLEDMEQWACKTGNSGQLYSLNACDSMQVFPVSDRGAVQLLAC